MPSEHPNCSKCNLPFNGKRAKRFSVYDKTLKQWFQYHPQCAPFWPTEFNVYQIVMKVGQ